MKFYDEVLATEQQAADAGEGLSNPAVACTIPAQLDEAKAFLQRLPLERPRTGAWKSSA